MVKEEDMVAKWDLVSPNWEGTMMNPDIPLTLSSWAHWSMYNLMVLFFSTTKQTTREDYPKHPKKFHESYHQKHPKLPQLSNPPY